MSDQNAGNNNGRFLEGKEPLLDVEWSVSSASTPSPSSHALILNSDKIVSKQKGTTRSF